MCVSVDVSKISWFIVHRLHFDFTAIKYTCDPVENYILEYKVMLNFMIYEMTWINNRLDFKMTGLFYTQHV